MRKSITKFSVFGRTAHTYSLEECMCRLKESALKVRQICAKLDLNIIYVYSYMICTDDVVNQIHSIDL